MSRRAIVTGAGGGIGGATARRLAADGIAVGLFDIDAAAVHAVQADIVASGGTAMAFVADCGDPVAVAAACDSFALAIGRPDILVSGVAYERHGGLLQSEVADIRRALEVTVVGAYGLLQHVASAMLPGGGRIVVISSPHAVRPFANAIGYNLAEAALRQLALTAAHELAPHRIAVNLVEPGWTDTPGERLLYSEQFLARSAESLPWGRRASPDEIAAAIAWLVSPEAGYVSGTTIRVDGAMAVSMARLPGVQTA